MKAIFLFFVSLAVLALSACGKDDKNTTQTANATAPQRRVRRTQVHNHYYAYPLCSWIYEERNGRWYYIEVCE